MTDTNAEFRDRLATERGITDADRDLLLTGTDEETLTQQADRLGPLPDLRNGNIAPREGFTVERGKDRNKDMRKFTGDLFGNTDPWG